MERERCDWSMYTGGGDPLYRAYHDEEWGRPVHDDKVLFEFLILEIMQAGLSWATILRKRDAFRDAFDGFDPEKVARYGEREMERLMGNAAIIRNRRKIEASVENAKAFLRTAKEFGSFDAFLWHYTDGIPIVNAPRSVREIPAQTPLSREIAKDLKRRGFRFLGPTIVYSYLQAVGIVNDHTADCFVYHELCGEGRKGTDKE